MAKQSIDDLAVIISASTEQLAGDLARAAGMFKNFAKLVEQQPKPFKDAGAGLGAAYGPLLRGAKDATVGFAGAVRSAAASMASFARQSVATATGIALYQAGVGGLSAVVDTVKDSVRMAADLEQTQLAFEVMLGSAERATEMVAQLRRFAATTPFNNQEVLAAARSLVAYGVAADQIVPTIRMLGDVSAAFGKDLPLARSTYLYGTLFAQQRAYAIDIRQFAMAGVPIIKELEKVTGASAGDLARLVEEGRIGRDEVTRAFKNMTEAGGKFHDMTKRQADTVAGVWEAASDAWAQAKTKFGQVVIEETGLKDAMRDFAAFSQRIEQGISAPNSPVRQAVRFVGDLVKTVIQAGYEIGRFAAKWVDLRLGDQLRLPDVNSKEWGLAVAEGLVVPIAGMVDSVEEYGKDFADAINTYFLNPLRAVRDTYRDLRGGFQAVAAGSAVVDRPNKFTEMFGNPELRNRIAGDKNLDKAVANFGPALGDVMDYRDARTREPFTFRALQPGESHEQFAERYRMLDAAIGMAQNLEARGVARGGIMAEELLKLRQQNFIAPFGGDFAALHQAYLTGQSPPGAKPDIKHATRRQAAEEIFRRMRDEDAVKAQGGGYFAGLTAQVRAELDRRAGVFGGAIPALGGPFAATAGAAAPGNGVRLMGDVPAHLVELANRVKDEMDPLAKILRDQADLTDAVRFGKLTRREADWANDRNVRQLAEHLGIGGEVRLPDAAMKDTTESARILTHWAAGMEPMTTNELLRQIRDLLDRGNRDRNRATNELGQAIPEVQPLQP